MTAARISRPIRQPKKAEPPASYGPWPSAVALVLVVLALLAITANMFTVKRVEVIGANLPVDQIVAAANVSGKNIFRVRSDAIVARVDGIPAVEVSRVDTSLPGTVKIYAALRQPYAAWQSGRVIFVLDQTGRIIGQTSRTSLALVMGGAHPPGFAVLQATRYAESIVPSQPDGALAQIQMDPKYGMTLTGHSGWQAVIGNGDPQALVGRVATLAALLRAINKKGQSLKYADLRYREPYYRPR